MIYSKTVLAEKLEEELNSSFLSDKEIMFIVPHIISVKTDGLVHSYKILYKIMSSPIQAASLENAGERLQ